MFHDIEDKTFCASVYVERPHRAKKYWKMQCKYIEFLKAFGQKCLNTFLALLYINLIFV